MFRADSSHVIGSGHIRRCLLLANKFAAQGARIVFLTRQLPQNSISLVQDQGYAVHVIGVNSDDVEVAETENQSWMDDANSCLSIINQEGLHPDLLIVDHYGLSSTWERRMRSAVNKILVIDDLANRPHFADALLDHNYRPTASVDYKRLTNDNCRLFLGPTYVLLRDEFLNKQPRKRSTLSEQPVVFVFFGSTDPADATSAMILALREHPLFNQMKFKILVGLENPRRQAIRNLAANSSRIHLLEGCDNMANLMRCCDFAIGAGGTTTWERCALGIPAVVVSIAKNQEHLSALLADAGAILYAGSTSTSGWPDTTLSLLSQLYHDDRLSSRLSATSQQMVTPNRLDELLVWAMNSQVNESQFL